MRNNNKNNGCDPSNSQRCLLGTLLFILLQTQTWGWDLALEFGLGDESTKRGGFGIQWEWEKRWLAEGDWYLGGYWEASFSYWDGKKGESGNSSLIAPKHTRPSGLGMTSSRGDHCKNNRPQARPYWIGSKKPPLIRTVAG